MKYAYFLNELNEVTNSIVCENTVNTDFLNSTLELEAFSEASSYVLVDDKDRKSYIGVGATYANGKFTPKNTEKETSEWSFAEEKWIKKPFNSWLWNSEIEQWEAPVSKPSVENPDDVIWEEETLSWKERVIPGQHSIDDNNEGKRLNPPLVDPFGVPYLAKPTV